MFKKKSNVQKAQICVELFNTDNKLVDRVYFNQSYIDLFRYRKQIVRVHRAIVDGNLVHFGVLQNV